MFLTFSLFLGIAVVGICAYVLLILRAQVEESSQATYMATTLRVRELVMESSLEQDAVIALEHEIRMAGYHVSIFEGDSAHLHIGMEEYHPTPSSITAVRNAVLSREPPFFFRHQLEDGHNLVITADILGPAERWLMVVQPEDPVHDAARTLQLTLLLGMCTVLILALVASWIASGRITRPLRAIQRSADNIARGNYDTPIRVQTRAAEIQDLAQHLDDMSARYREKIVDLDRLATMQGEFIGNVGHEVRNPIFAMSGFLEALKNPDLNGTTRAYYAEKASDNLKRLSNLFVNLIEIAQLEYREDLLEPETFDIAELIRHVIESLQPAADEQGVTIEASAEPIQVLADSEHIRRVLVNLLENALVYGEGSPVTCACRIHHGRALIEVSDAGPGIEERHLARVFERFYRVDHARARKSGGSGLGLSIVKQVLQAHGEAIRVDSEPGFGSRFWFELPLAEQS